MSTKQDQRNTWTPPTRRSFMAMLGAAAAAFAIRSDAPKPAAPTRPRWIGHY